MNRIIITACMILLALSAQAQRNQRNNNGGNARQQTARELKSEIEVYTQRAEQYVEQWDLSTETGAKFTQLYIEWQQKRMNIIDKYGMDQKAGADINFKKISEEEAEKLVAEDFERLEQQAEIDREYYAKFKEIVTPAHAAQAIVQQRNRAAGMMSMFRNMGRGGMGGMMMMF